MRAANLLIIKKSAPLWISLWIILVIISTFIKLYPLRAHIGGDAYAEASYIIEQSLLQHIQQNSPEMPPPVAKQVAEKMFNDALLDTKDQKMQLTIEDMASSLIKQKRVISQVSLLGDDSNYFFNLTDGLVHNNHAPNDLQNDQYLNLLMTPPFGYWQQITAHPSMGLMLYKITKLFNADIPLVSVVAFVPIITNLLILGAFCWACSLLEYSVLASFIGCLFFTLMPICLKEGCLGTYGLDQYNLLFPTILLGQFILILRSTTAWTIYGGSLLAALTVLCYAFFSEGWLLMYFIGIISGIVVLGYNLLFKKDRLAAKNNFIFLFLFFIGTLLFICMFFSLNYFIEILKETLILCTSFNFTGEGFKTLFLQRIINNSGNIIFLIVATIYWVYAILHLKHLNLNEKTKNREQYGVLILSTFLILAFVMSFLRQDWFSLFVLIPVAFLFTGAVNAFYKIHRLIPIRLIVSVLFIVLVLADANHNVRAVMTPILSSSWEKIVQEASLH